MLTQAAKTHGLDGTLVAPDWPPLNLAELRALLKAFPDAGDPLEILSTSPRPFSAASVVKTTAQTIFVKRHARSVRDAEGLTEEHRFINHLRTQGIAVPRVFANPSGLTAIESGDSTYEVHSIPTGFDLYEDAISWTPFQSESHARAAGTMLAKLHLASENYTAPSRRPRQLVASFTIFASQNALKQFLSLRPTLNQHVPSR